MLKFFRVGSQTEKSPRPHIGFSNAIKIPIKYQPHYEYILLPLCIVFVARNASFQSLKYQTILGIFLSICPCLQIKILSYDQFDNVIIMGFKGWQVRRQSTGACEANQVAPKLLDHFLIDSTFPVLTTWTKITLAPCLTFTEWTMRLANG